MNASDDGNNNPSQNQNNPLENEQRKKGKGRQKITMAKIENETNLQVTFSKRRAGVFKKASELSTLCGAESAVVVFSPGNKPHSFGHPNVETVANRFLHANAGADAPPRANAADQLIVAHGEAAMHQRNQELVALEAELEREKRRKKELDGLNSGGQAPPQLDELDYEELDQLRKSVLGFKHEFEAKVKNVGSSSHWGGDGAGAGASTAVDSSAHHHHHHLGSPDYGYGGSSINHNAANPSIGSSYGYTVQYPPVAPAGSHAMTPYNYGADPAAVVQYDAATDAGRQATRPDDINKFQGFGGNYRRPDF